MKFIQAAENNKTEILQFFAKTAKLGDEVLEIGSGTGQHIVYFATQMEHVVWQPSEKQGNTASVEERVKNADLVIAVCVKDTSIIKNNLLCTPPEYMI